ncbi:EP300-interacting inhibitor of differentiation 3 [Maniola hyperantus]|uniref:EP300-interacting inhibitor of differentiation 3 n=1 Tax=Aphantopus hyperantus TaxID=2795564 RepID=UPI00156A15EE|nr:EP300-interacting inhibitor of differentiation 3 [Maniola hyperantus]
MSGSSFNASQQSRSSFTNHERRFFFGEITQEVQNISEEDNINHEERIRKLGEIIDKVESEAPSVNNNSLYTGDYYLHSRVLKDTSELTKRCTEQVTGEVNNYDKFALAQSIAENPDFWDFTFPYEVPAVSYLFGTFAPTPLEERPRVPRKRVERQRPGDVKAPQKLDLVSKKPDEGTERVQQVLRFVTKVCKSGPISYFHLVLDPNCFTRTIENIYDMSFLARDGLVAVNLDEKAGLPFVTRMGGEKKRRAEDNEENQFVVSMDMQRWRDLTQAFGIRKPMMKT